MVAALTDVASYNDGGPLNKDLSDIGTNDNKCLVNNAGLDNGTNLITGFNPNTPSAPPELSSANLDNRLVVSTKASTNE